MRRNGYLYTSGVNLDTAVRFADPDFLLECNISAIWRRFTLIFAFNILNIRFRFVWLTDLKSMPHASTPTSIIRTKFEVDMTIHCWVIAFLSADTSRDFVTLTFDLEQLLCMAGNVTNLATKFEDPMPICCWFMSHNVSRWLLLRMRTRPLRMRRITWTVSMGSKTITFLESPTLICLFTLHLRWLYDECN